MHRRFPAGRRIASRRASWAALALAVTLVGTTATGAVAASGSARVDIEVVDLAGAAVEAVTVTLTAASGATETVTTDEWGGARSRLEVATGDTILVTAPGTVEGSATLSAEPGERYDLELTVAIAQGYERVNGVRDADGDGTADILWHRANAGAQDDWLVQGGDGSVTQTRFASGNVAWAGMVRIDATPGVEAVALEQIPGGYRMWTWHVPLNEESRVDLGEIPGFDFLEYDLDGDGLKDLLFYGSEPGAGGFDFVAAFGDGGVARFALGGATSTFYPELADVTGDGLPDVFVAEAIPGTTIRWDVWESDDQAVHSATLGTHGETVFDDTLLDGDSDGLPEFLGGYYVDGVNRGWEVLEYATGEQFAVVLGPEDDRGPSSHDYPATWATP